MKSSKRPRLFERLHIEAFVIGLLVGLAALLLERWVGDRGWTTRIVALIGVGGLICLTQLAMIRLGRK